MHSVNLSKPYFLYIEDDIEDVELLQHALAHTSFGYNIVHMFNGNDALDFLEQSKQFSRLPELIFLDINMSRMDGKETLVCLKADKDIARIPTVVLSTSNLDTDIAYFRKFHIPYIIKPGNVSRFKDEVLDVVKGLLAFDVEFATQTRSDVA